MGKIAEQNQCVDGLGNNEHFQNNKLFGNTHPAAILVLRVSYTLSILCIDKLQVLSAGCSLEILKTLMDMQRFSLKIEQRKQQSISSMIMDSNRLYSDHPDP